MSIDFLAFMPSEEITAKQLLERIVKINEAYSKNQNRKELSRSLLDIAPFFRKVSDKVQPEYKEQPEYQQAEAIYNKLWSYCLEAL